MMMSMNRVSAGENRTAEPLGNRTVVALEVPETRTTGDGFVQLEVFVIEYSRISALERTIVLSWVVRNHHETKRIVVSSQFEITMSPEKTS